MNDTLNFPTVQNLSSNPYTLIDTVDFFIQELEGDLESISWEIREATNFDDCSETVSYLSEIWDDKKFHLDNLINLRCTLVK